MTTTPAIRVVLDTNTWLDLLWFHDSRCAALAAALADRRLVAVSSAACRFEWRRVLSYPELAIDAARRAELCARFDDMTEVVDTTGTTPTLPRCRDPDDQKFLELAHAANAAALFTRDAELLALANRCRRAGLFQILQPLEVVGVVSL